MHQKIVFSLNKIGQHSEDQDLDERRLLFLKGGVKGLIELGRNSRKLLV